MLMAMALLVRLVVCVTAGKAVCVEGFVTAGKSGCVEGFVLLVKQVV